MALVGCERKVVIILIIIVDSRVVDNDRRRSRRWWGSTALGSGSMYTHAAGSRNEVAARPSLIVRARGRPVAMLGIDDGSWGTTTAHANIDLVIFVVVTAHLGEASKNV